MARWQILPEKKDFTRLQDIEGKSQWTRDRMIKFALTMAKLITKGDKALRRAKAAEILLGPSHICAIIFYSRALELGASVRDIEEIHSLAIDVNEHGEVVTL